MCVNFYLQILSQSLVTPGTRCPLSAAPPQPVQSMHSLYLPMAYTWPHPLIRRSTFGQPKHEGYFTRWSCYLSHGLCLTMVFRFPNATTEFVTQIAFSPTRNLL